LEKYGVIYPYLMMWREEGVKNTQSKIVGGFGEGASMGFISKC